MDLTTPKWHHDPTRTGDHAPHGPGHDDATACWDCWCYSCGGRTDLPRIRRGDTRTSAELAKLGDEPADDHRWCYE